MCVWVFLSVHGHTCGYTRTSVCMCVEAWGWEVFFVSFFFLITPLYSLRQASQSNSELTNGTSLAS